MSQTPTSEPLELMERAAPKVVGIISIIWSILGLTCGACGVVGPFLQQWGASFAEEKLGPMPKELLLSPLQSIAAGGGMVWALILLAAGITCVSRKPTTRGLHLIYAAGALVLAIIGLVLGVMNNLRVIEYVRDHPGDKWAQQAHPEFAWFGMGIGTLLALAWPIFCLIWFGFIKRDMRELDAGPAPAA